MEVRSTKIRFVSCFVWLGFGGPGFRRASLGKRKGVIRMANNLKERELRAKLTGRLFPVGVGGAGHYF